MCVCVVSLGSFIPTKTTFPSAIDPENVSNFSFSASQNATHVLHESSLYSTAWAAGLKVNLNIDMEFWSFLCGIASLTLHLLACIA